MNLVFVHTCGIIVGKMMVIFRLTSMRIAVCRWKCTMCTSLHYTDRDSSIPVKMATCNRMFGPSTLCQSLPLQAKLTWTKASSERTFS